MEPFFYYHQPFFQKPALDMGMEFSADGDTQQGHTAWREEPWKNMSKAIPTWTGWPGPPTPLGLF